MIVDGSVLHFDPYGRSINLVGTSNVYPHTVFGMSLASLVVEYEDPTPPDYVPVPAIETEGVRIPTTMEDWYYRMHFVPVAIALGNMSGDQEREMYLWNANFVPVDVESFALVNAGGITFEADQDAPYTLAPLGTSSYTFTISSTGPAIVDATAEWTVDGIEYVVPIAGLRTTLFGFRPNWRVAVKETLEWKTTIATAYAGIEQRQSVRDKPRRIFEYEARIFSEDVQLFDVLTYGWNGRMMSLPLWHEKAKLTQPALAGDTVIYLPTAGKTYQVGSSALLYANARTSEALQVAEVHADRLVLSGPLLADWGQGSVVYPTLVCAPPDEYATTRQLPTHLDVTSRFVASPVECIARMPVIAPEALYLGRELYTKETNWIAPLSVRIDARRLEVDNTFGPIRIAPKTKFPLITRPFSWLCKNIEQSEDLRGFFARRWGRKNSVWMPSGVEDLTVIENIPFGDNVFQVRKSEYGAFIGGQAARTHVIFIMRNGDRFARKIESMSGFLNESLLQLDTGFPYTISPADIKRVSYLGLYRLGSDQVTFEWVTDTVSRVTVQFMLTEPWQ